MTEFVDCSEVMSRMFIFIDNELDHAHATVIESHLLECGPCKQRYLVETTVKSLVARACPEVAPAGLKDRVLFNIRGDLG